MWKWILKHTNSLKILPSKSSIDCGRSQELLHVRCMSMSDCPSWQISSWFWQVSPVCGFGEAVCQQMWHAHSPYTTYRRHFFLGETSVLSDSLSLPIATSESLSGWKLPLASVKSFCFCSGWGWFWQRGREVNARVAFSCEGLYWLPACEQRDREIHYWGVQCLQVISRHSTRPVPARVYSGPASNKTSKQTKTRLTFYMILWRENFLYLNSNATYIMFVNEWKVFSIYQIS